MGMADGSLQSMIGTPPWFKIGHNTSVSNVSWFRHSRVPHKEFLAMMKAMIFLPLFTPYLQNRISALFLAILSPLPSHRFSGRSVTTQYSLELQRPQRLSRIS